MDLKKKKNWEHITSCLTAKSKVQPALKRVKRTCIKNKTGAQLSICLDLSCSREAVNPDKLILCTGANNLLTCVPMYLKA